MFNIIIEDFHDGPGILPSKFLVSYLHAEKSFLWKYEIKQAQPSGTVRPLSFGPGEANGKQHLPSPGFPSSLH